MKELRLVVIGLLAATALSFAAMAALAAETVTVAAGHHPGFGRVAFRWSSPIDFTVEQSGDELVIRFARPFDGVLKRITEELGDYVSAARQEDDGKSVRLTLKKPYRMRSFKDGKSVAAIDLVGVPEKSASDAPAAEKKVAGKKTAEFGGSAAQRRTYDHKKPAVPPAHEEAKLADAVTPGAGEGPRIPVRRGEHEGYDRIVFDWPRTVSYRVKQDGGRAIVSFDQAGRIDLGLLGRDPSRFAPAVKVEAFAGGAQVDLQLADGVRVRDFRDGPRVVLDLLSPTATGKAPVQQKTPSAFKVPAEIFKPTQPIMAAAAQPEATSTPVLVRIPPRTKEGAGATGAPLPNIKQAESQSASASSPKSGNAAANTTLTVAYSTSDGGASLRFPWNEPVALAAFRRDQTLWLVFDRATHMDIAQLPVVGDGKNFEEASLLPHPRATILRVKIADGINPKLRLDGSTWIVDLAKNNARPDVPIAVRPEPKSPIGPRVNMAVVNPSYTVDVTDPDSGDKLVIIALNQPGWGIFETRNYVEFRLLGTAQGIVVEPHNDGVMVNSRKDAVDILSEKGLLLSTAPEPPSAGTAFGSADTTPDLFDLGAWRAGKQDSPVSRKQALQLRLAQATPGDRDKARLELARFYFAMGLSSEAEGLIDLVAKDKPSLLEARDMRAMRGALAAIDHDYANASKLLGDKSLADAPEVALWRGAIAAEQGDYAAADHEFLFGGALIGNYAHPIQFRLGVLAATTALARGNQDRAKAILDGLEKSDLSTEERGRVAYLRGRQMMVAGRSNEALHFFDDAEKSGDALGAAQATLARVALLEKEGQMPRKEAIKQLDGLRYVWRGDKFELDLLDRLGRLYFADGDYRDGLTTLRRAVTYFPSDPRVKSLAELMSNGFAEVFSDDMAAKIPPLTAVAIYDDFKELAPTGPAGDQLALKLADRLVAVDLLDRAGKVLDNLIKTRLSGKEKAQVGARLAKVRLLDNRPDLALQALAASAVDGLPDDAIHERGYLEARALAATGKVDEALAKLADDDSAEADQIRSEAFWKGHKWTEAAAVYWRMLKQLPRAGQMLDQRETDTVLRLGVALTMLGNQPELDMLRGRFAKAIPEGAPRAALQVMNGNIGQPGEDFRQLANTVAQIDRFKTFMTDYRKEFDDRAKATSARVATN